MPNMSVNKTLIVGLGSTGTEVCDMIAERIEWELGDVSKSPWVRMLCIETDADKQTLSRDLNDFLAMTLSSSEFREMKASPDLYDEQIDLSSWAHAETLGKLPENQVNTGAGNIRMVGRLAFLHQRNHNKIHQEISRRLTGLRGLTAAEATEKRGQMPDGSNPDIDFGDNSVTVIAVGTLCGGTCSGIASDFGYFLRKICKDDDKRIAIFTLPHPGLTPANEPKANCFKKNAYHALVELNHYHLSDRGGARSIKYPDGTQQRVDCEPWDIPYLAMPRAAMKEHVQQLNRAIADRAFLYVFAPETCPQADLVNATIFDRDNRSHVFCSFGLATLEFPVQQVTEACAKKLLSFAIKEWSARTLPDVEHEARLTELGLTWSHLTEMLLTGEDGESIRKRIDAKREEVLNLARTNADAAMTSLEELRTAFSVTDMAGSPTTAQLRGIAPRTVQGNRQSAAEGVITRLRSVVDARLLKYDEGISPLRQTLRLARERLVQLRQARKPDFEEEREQTDRLMARLAAYHDSTLLGLMRLKEAAIDRTVYLLRQSLETELKQRLESEAWKAMQTVQDQHGQSSGVAERIERLLNPIEKRADNLNIRLITLANRLDARCNELSRNAPEMNGLCIFVPEVAPGSGTVAEEYERCLIQEDPAETLDRMRRKYATEVIRAWRDLPGAIVPPASPERDWLLEEFQPNTDQAVIPAEDVRELEAVARQPFRSLVNIDVLERWRARESADLEASEVTHAASPFLEVSPAVAERGGRSPINKRCVVLSPASQAKTRFQDVVQVLMSQEPKKLPSPNAFRAIIMEEWYRFPLSGALAIMGENGICHAQCTDFPLFFTRNDVQWMGLSDADMLSIRQAEELVTVMILLKILQPQGGALVLPWTPAAPGDPDHRRLPLEVKGAARLLAAESQDKDGNSLRGAMAIARDKIEYERNRVKEPGRNQRFVELLDERVRQGTGSEVQGWDVKSAGARVAAFCAGNQEIFKAYLEKYPPDAATVSAMRRSTGDEKPGGGRCDQDGLYCPQCGGFIGIDEADAAKNLWTCFVNPDHYYGSV